MLADRRRQGLADPSTLVFSSCTEGTGDRRTLLSRQLKPAAKAVGLTNLTWHLLRHSNATLHDSLGTPLGTVQALLGHSSSEITRQVYRCTCIRCRRIGVSQRRNWRRIYLDPSWTQVSTGENWRFQNVLGAEELARRGDRI